MAKPNEILDPTLDTVFFMLANEKYINDFLKPLCLSVARLSAEEVAEISIIDPRIPKNSPNESQGIVDVLMRTCMGTTVHIEIQRRYFKNINVRTNVQHSKLHGSQIDVGFEYSKVHRTITLLISKSRLFENEEYFCRYVMANSLTGQIFDDSSEIYALVLSQLPKESDDTDVWVWGKFFKARTEEELDMLARDNPIIQRAVAVLKDLSKDEVVRWQAEREMIYQLDQIDREATVREEGIEIGVLRTAVKAINLGLDDATIAAIADISTEHVRALRAKNEEANREGGLM